MFKKKSREEIEKKIEDLKKDIEKNPDLEVEKREPVAATVATTTKEPKKTEIWTVGEIPTQTQPVIVNTRTDENLDLYLAQARMLNILESILEAIK